MRITSAMQQKWTVDLENSPYRKKTDDQIKKSSTNTTDTAAKKQAKDTISCKIGKEMIIEKTGDKVIVSRIDKNNAKTTLQEFKSDSQAGKTLVDLIQSSGTSQLKNCLSDMRDAKRSASLTNYL